MLKPFYMDNAAATSESESEIELVRLYGQLPSEPAAPLPTVVVKKSSDIHVGPRLHYNGPVTVKQYITVKGNDDVESLAENPDENTNTITTQPPEGANPVDVALKHNSKYVLTIQKHAWLRNRYVWSLLVFVLVAAIITALVAALSGAESNSATPIVLEFENEDVDVLEDRRSVQWVVNVTASSQPKLVWYGPNCTVLEEHDGPTRHEVHTSPTRTELKIYNTSLADRGVYRLQASNEEGEEWAYFTLNVKGNNPLDRQHVVVCYIASWAQERQGLAKFTVDNIDPTLCSHLVYAFAVLNMTTNAIQSAKPELDLEENNGIGAYRKMTSLKRDYPHLKVLLGMGGWRERWDKKHSEVAESPSRRKALVTSISEFLRKYNFDGLDLYWLHPVEMKDFPAYKKNILSLLKDLRQEFDKFGLLLMAPVAMMPDATVQSYDLPAVSQYLHYMFAQCYNYYDETNPLTGPNAPLYPLYDDELSVSSSINTLLSKGADPNKLVLGLPLYGRIFKLRYPEAGVGFEKESEGAGMGGRYLQFPGFWGYNEICLGVDNPTNNWKKYWDNVTHTPYASKFDQFISYDDAMSFTDKVELAVRKKLAGVGVHTLDMDDFRGSCNFGRSGSTDYPLMRAINKALDYSVSWKKFPCPSRSSATVPVD